MSELAVLAALEKFSKELWALKCEIALVYGVDEAGKPFVLTGSALGEQQVRDSIHKTVELAK